MRRAARGVPLVLREAPQRTCVGCRQRRRKDELLRVTRAPQGVRLDLGQDLPGRGAYICPDPQCVASASRRGGQALGRALRGAPRTEVHRVIEQLYTLVGERRGDEQAPKEQEA